MEDTSVNSILMVNMVHLVLFPTNIYLHHTRFEETLFTICNTHSGMGGSPSNTTPFISLENGNTDSSNTNSEYIDFENPNRQGDQFLSGETIKGPIQVNWYSQR